MRRLVYLFSARDDLNDILRFITRESKSRPLAQSFVNALREQCRTLARLPGTLGRQRLDLRPDIRSFAVKGYVIFFRYTNDAVEIVDVFEGHRDIDAQFRTE